jgi:hypothetical protein
MIVCYANQCAYCRSAIAAGQRWVREKIYTPESQSPRYNRYHAEPYGRGGLSGMP